MRKILCAFGFHRWNNWRYQRCSVCDTISWSGLAVKREDIARKFRHDLNKVIRESAWFR